MNLIDTHAHMADERLWQNIDVHMEEATAAGIVKIINICTDRETFVRGKELRERYPWLHNAAATTPHDVAKLGDEDFSLFAEAAQKGELIAIGETGLDYFYHHSPPDMQRQFLRRYLRLAKEVHLPVIIHCRDAFIDLFQIADEEYRDLPLILHCFTGTPEEAKEAAKRGWYVSFSGIVTFKKSIALREALHHVPLSSLLIETDAPYLAPQSMRGALNRPSLIRETAQCLADTLGKTLEEIATLTTENATKLFFG